MTGVETFVGLTILGVEIGTTAAAIISVVVNTAIASLLGKILAPSLPKGARTGKGVQANRKSNIMPRKVVYGEAVVGGPFVFMESFGTQNQNDSKVHNLDLQMVIALTGHPVEDVLGVFFGEDYIRINDGTNDLNGQYEVTNGPFGETDKHGNYLVKIIKVKGWAWADKTYVNNEVGNSDVTQDQTRANLIANQIQANWSTTGLTRDSGTGLWDAGVDREKLTNCSFVFLRLRYHYKKLSQLPTIRFHVKGKRIYNPYNDTTNMSAYGAVGSSHDLFDPDTYTWSQDWSLCVLDYLINTKYGLGATSDPNALLCEVDWEEAINAYLSSSEVITNGLPSPDTDTATRYTINGAFEVDAAPLAIMETLLTAGAGEIVYAQGKYKIRPGVYRLPNSANDIINEDMMVSPLTITTHVPRGQIFNKAAGIFLDKGYLDGTTPSSGNPPTFEPTDFPIIDPLDSSGLNPYEVQDGEEIIKDFDYPFTVRSFEAQRLARIQLERVRRGFTVQFKANLQVLKYSVGDTVYLEILNDSKYTGEVFYNHLGLDDAVQLDPVSPKDPYYKQFKIVDMQYGENFTIDVTMVEEAEEIYEWSEGYASPSTSALISDIPADDWKSTIIPPSWIVDTPYSTVVETASGNDIITALRWSMPDRGSTLNALDGAHVSSYEVQFGIVSNPSQVSPRDTRVDTWLSAGLVFAEIDDAVQGPVYITNIYQGANTDYDFRVRSVLHNGRRSDWAYYSDDIGSDFSPTVPDGAVRYYIAPLNGTTIKNGFGTLTLQSRRVTAQSDDPLTTGTIQLYDENGYLVSTASPGNYPSPSDGYIGTFTDTEIVDSLIVRLRDGAGGTIYDSVNLTDITDGSSPSNIADVYLYQRTATESPIPDGPLNNIEYEFSSGTLVSPNNDPGNSWTTDIPLSSDPILWRVKAQAFNTASTDIISPSEWTTAAVFSIDGAPGADGLAGYLTKEAEVIDALNDGTGYTLPGNPVSTFKVFSGETDITDTTAVTYAGGGTQNGLTASISNSIGTKGQISLSGASWTSNTETFSFTATYGAAVITRIYTISKAIKGNTGDTGGAGLNNATVTLYNKNTSGVTPPTLFSGTFTYTFSTGVLSGGTLNGWSQDAPTLSAGEYLWASQATASSSIATDSVPTGDFNTPQVVGIGGADGTDGLNVATVTLYNKNTSGVTPPAAFSGTFTYTFSTGILSGGSLNGWSQDAPTLSAGEYLWARQAYASASTPTDSVPTGDFNTAQVVGIAGNDGSDGLNNATVTLYNKNTSGVTPPTLFSGTFTYTFSTGVLSGGTLNGWSQDAPTLSAGEYLWASQSTASSNTSTDSVPTGDFNTPQVVGIGGTDGTNGLNVATVTLYNKNTSGVTPPTLFSGTFTYTFSTGLLSGGTLNGWSQNAPSLGAGEYLWASQAFASASTPTDSVPTGDFNTPQVVGLSGAQGASGRDGAIVAGVVLNSQVFGSPYTNGYMFVHGIDTNGDPADTNGSFYYDGAVQTLIKGFFSAGLNVDDGYIAYDMSTSGNFFTKDSTAPGGESTRLAGVRIDATEPGTIQWLYDDSADWTEFTPNTDLVIIGTYQADSSGVLSATITAPVVLSTLVIHAGRISTTRLDAVSAVIGSLKTRAETSGATTPRLDLTNSISPISIWAEDDTTKIFGISQIETTSPLDYTAAIFLKGDFEANSLDTAQAFSSLGLSDLRGRLGLLEPSGASDQTGGLLSIPNTPVTLSGTSGTIQLTDPSPGFFNSAGTDVTLSFRISDYTPTQLGTVPTPAQYTVYWETSTNGSSWTQISATNRTFSGSIESWEHPYKPLFYWEYTLDRTFVDVVTVTAGDAYFRLNWSHNGGYTNNDVVNSGQASEPIVGGGVLEAHSHAWSDITSTPTTLAGYGITDATFDNLGSKTSGTGDYQTTGDFIADNFEATGLGPNSTPGTDDLYIGGYGILGSRTNAVYVSNAAGPVYLNHTGVHNVNTKLATTATGVSVTGTMDATTVTGANVTTGEDPGHTHTAYSLTSHNHTLDSLSNVTITGNTSGELLKWNGSAWINNTLAEAGIIGGSITDNQVAVGAATANSIEGSANLTYDATYLAVGGASTGARLRGWAATLTPTLIPNGGDLDTGFNQAGANEANIIAGGVEMWRFDNDGTATTRYNLAKYPVYIAETTLAGNDVPAYGQLWVKNQTTYNDLFFTDDTGQDIQITDNGVLAAAGGSIGGSIADNQVAVGAATANTIEGVAGFTFNSGTGTVTATTFSGALSGNATTATAWATTRTINMSGDVSSDAVNIDGSGNITITNTAVANDSHTHAFNNLGSKTAGTGNYQTTGNFIADSFEATGLGLNSTPGTDDLFIGGYGILGDRTQAIYVSNVSGPVRLNHGGIHGSANTKLETSATGITVTGAIDVPTINNSAGVALQHNGTTMIQTQAVNTDGNTSGASIEDANSITVDVGFNVMMWKIKNAGLVSTDNSWRDYAGHIIYSTTGSYTWTTPASTDAVVPVGTTYTLAKTGTGSINIAAGTGVTLNWLDGAGGATGTRTLSQGGVATLNKQTASQWYIWGNGALT